MSQHTEPPKRKRGRPPSSNSGRSHAYLPPDLQPPVQEKVEEEEAVVDNENEDENDDDEDDDDEDEDVEDEDDDEEYDESGELVDSTPRTRRKSGRMAGKKQDSASADDEPAVDEKRRKRGRPPTVDKPHESRIKAIMRALRKARISTRLLYLPFERLPDSKQYPEYYREISHPIALDMIKKKIKRRQYPDVDSFMRDVNLMFENAKEFNAPQSVIYKDTVALQKIVGSVASEEINKPDSAFQDPESNSSRHARMPLDGIEHNGEIYRVGDWVHISNLNDPSRPTIGQIFRTWQAPDGRKWINACWYYRPEQTVHRYDKYFYENEVVKSGQYRDHLIEEVLEKCFVMFFTKYQRGRPVGIGNRAVYCCESRYNENEKTFNKIRTWKACIPDEVRSVDYEMDLFDRVRPLKKVPSPIKHLLPENAKDDDPIPESKLGVENAPPIIGAVYKRPPDPNAKDRTPTPDPPSPVPPTMSSSRADSAVGSPHARNSSLPRNSVERTFSNPKLISRPELGRFGTGMSMSGTPTPPLGTVYPFGTQPITPLGFGNAPSVNRSAMYNPPPPPSTFTLPDYITDRIPPDTAELYQKDDNGKLLWFSVPPIDSMNVTDNGVKGIVGHSIEFLAKRKEIEDKRKERALERELLFKRTKI